MRFWISALGLGLVWGAVGCSDQSQVSEYDAALRQASTCDDVLDAIHQDEIEKVRLELKSFVEQDYYGWGWGRVAVDAGAEGDFNGPVPAGAGGTGGAGDAPSGFSDTNRQVADVDEADIVKVGDDGRKLYVLRGNAFYEFDSWPAAQTSKVADVEIEGGPIEMFVEGNRAVVFSSVYGVQQLDDGDLCQGYGYPEPAIVEGDYYYGCGRSYVKTTVIDLSTDPATVIREIYVDGWYTSSRRHESIVRAVVQSSMQRPATVPYLYDVVYNGPVYPQNRDEEIFLANFWAQQAIEAIGKTTLDQWLPVWGERIDGEIVAQPHQCADFYSPTPGMTNYGLTQVVGIDLASSNAPAIASILGQATTVYANRDALVLAQPDWSWFERDINTDRTAVHRFAVSAGAERTPYLGSGFVPGVVKDQFSIDEQEGIIRIATTRTTWHHQSGDVITPDVWIPPTTDNLVSTLRQDGEGPIEVIGQTPALAEGERIFSSRFLGDLAYVVTFRQVDPLFAIDLSDPENPEVLGELKIPGFSDYMHPLGDDYLLTIGRDIDEQTQLDRGTALQIFDVSDPVDPKLAHKALVGEGYSEANHNHKAFNFYAGESATEGLLAFPFVSYDAEFSSTLELWDVSAQDGFHRRGAVDHSDLVVNDCGQPYPVEDFYYYCGYYPQITRGVFIDEYIYSISHGGIRVHSVSDLTTPVATAVY